MTCPICGHSESDKPRSVRQNALYWQMLRLVCDHAEAPVFQGKDGPSNLHESLKEAMGYIEPRYDLNGRISGYKTKSISFHKMTPEKFGAFFDKAQTFIFEHVLPASYRDGFERELCNLLRIPTMED